MQCHRPWCDTRRCAECGCAKGVLPGEMAVSGIGCGRISGVWVWLVAESTFLCDLGSDTISEAGTSRLGRDVAVAGPDNYDLRPTPVRHTVTRGIMTFVKVLQIEGLSSKRVQFARAAMLVGGLVIVPGFALAQGTARDYANADRLAQRLGGLVVGAADMPNWSSNSNSFVYRRSVRGGYTFVWVDANTQLRRAAFDHARLADALAAATKRPVTPVTLPFTSFDFVDGDSAIEFTMRDGNFGPPGNGVRWHCALANYACAPLARATQNPERPFRTRQQFGGGLFGALPRLDTRSHLSPDGKQEALVRNYNVYVRSASDSTLGSMLSTDGSEGDAYDPESIVWSPESKRIAAYRVRPGFPRQVHYVLSSPTDQLQPKDSTLYYNKPGDVLDVDRPVLFDVAAHKQLLVGDALFPNAYSVTRLSWRKDSRAVTFEYNQRGHQAYRIIEIDSQSITPKYLQIAHCISAVNSEPC